MSQRFPYLFFNDSEVHGRGLFTGAPIAKDTLIESCPVIVLPPKDLPLIHETHLHDYYFLWGENDESCAIILGYGSLINHHNQPNAVAEPNYEQNTLDIYSLREIEAGEEIFISYNGDDDEGVDIWFEERGE